MGYPEENAHLERSHRTDDEEFYIPRVLQIKLEKDLLDEALGYIYYYNNLREHSSLNYQTPYQHLKKQLPEVDSSIRFVIPIMLDKVSVQIGRWSGYNVLAQHHIIVPLDKIHNYDESYRYNYRTGLIFSDIENMSGRAGILNFGRVIFLAYSLLSETIFQNIYFNCSQNNNQNYKGSIKYPLKKENDLLTFLL